MRRWARVLLSASSFVVGLAAALVSASALAQQADDGWRRTAHGWERANVVSAHDAVQFDNRFVFRRPTDLARPRWDFHPGLLAAGQLAAALAAFCFWRQLAAKTVDRTVRNGKEYAAVQETRPARTA